MSEVLRKCLGLNDIKTAALGCTIIDTNSEVGLCVEGSTMTSPRHDRQNIYNPNEALGFYPAVEQSEVENGSCDNVLALGPLWFNGFIPYPRGITDPENCCNATANMMSRFGVVTSDQLLKSRPDSSLENIYSAFKWYGGDDDDDRIVPKNLQIDTAISKVVRRGLVHPNWLVKPISIRYLVRELADEGQRDYAYIVGGTDYLLADNSKDIANHIGSMITKARGLLETDQSIPKEIQNNEDLNSVYKVWEQLDMSNYSDDFANHPYVQGKLLVREINRAIQGVIMIRNYFVYAKKHLGIEKVTDMSLKNGGEPTRISIDEVLERYNGAYKFVRNLCNCEEDIGKGRPLFYF